VRSTDLLSGDVERLTSEDEKRLPVGGMRRDFESVDEERLPVGGMKSDKVPGPGRHQNWAARAIRTRTVRAADGQRKEELKQACPGLAKPVSPHPPKPPTPLWLRAPDNLDEPTICRQQDPEVTGGN